MINENLIVIVIIIYIANVIEFYSHYIITWHMLQIFKSGKVYAFST